MKNEKRFLVDVGLKGLPFPMQVLSRENKEGQSTVADISVSARIMQDFEAEWIDKFIHILHQHRDRIGTSTLKANIGDYLKELKATTVRIDFSYPFFYEKLTPASKEKCMVRYQCTYSSRTSPVQSEPTILFRVEVPVITTYPVPSGVESELFGQLSVVEMEIEAKEDVFPEDLIDLIDQKALSPVYSFLTLEDQKHIINKIHVQRKTSVMLIDEIKDELAHKKNISWYSLRCLNYGMLHSYGTVVGTEKSMWVPFSGFEND